MSSAPSTPLKSRPVASEVCDGVCADPGADADEGPAPMFRLEGWAVLRCAVVRQRVYLFGHTKMQLWEFLLRALHTLAHGDRESKYLRQCLLFTLHIAEIA